MNSASPENTEASRRSLDIRGVSKAFGRFPALKNVSLQDQDKEFLALLGPSGSGKTTLLRVLAGLEQPDEGEVRFDGQDFLSLPVRKRRVGMVFQHYALFRHMTVAQNIAFGLTVRPRAERPSAKAIRERQPRVLLSAGNHFHWAAGPAYARAGRPSSTRLMGRASNAPPDRALPLLGPLAQGWDARKYKEMHTVVAVSRELAEMLSRDLKVPAQKIVTIPNGINVAAVEKLAAEPFDDPWFADGAPPVIVGAGRLSRAGAPGRS